ncbi:MAG TPA: TRAP transporter permease [Candidatus Enterocloster faecavium]|uniref:TRAP transporter permease n=1 Tax=Candidatus Enterocloster faecavium TaxID=2838560 RepID=A0A9D2LA57_9FIRM|nr:TRAP transporter permease [Candidatus Enterocloster faecavium]
MGLIGPGIISLIIFVGVTIIASVGFKRNIAWSMCLAWLASLLLAGRNIPSYAVESLKAGIINEVMYPSICFCFMAEMMRRTGIIKRLVTILNSIFGRIPGGAGYVSTMASALMGAVSGSGSGNAAVSGSITIPWMMESGFSDQLATTIVTGNATLGMSIPPSTSMFLMLAMPAIAGKCEAGALYVACLCGGMYVLAYRLLTVFYYTKRYKIRAVDRSSLLPLSEALRTGWKSLLIFFGVFIPLALTSGPVSEWLSAGPFGEDGVGSIDMMIWIPTLLVLITVLEGRKYLPKITEVKKWREIIVGDIMSYPAVGGTIIFSFAGSEVMTRLGLGAEMEAIFANLSSMPALVTIMVVGVILLILAGPLNSTGTLVTMGSVGFVALTSVGLRPATALTIMLLFAATEGCVPPASTPLVIASGISGLKDPSKCFKDLMFIYTTGSFVIATLVGVGILPIL